ncbi:ubiquitin-conjugating enzyme E2 [Medicago truncatula]|uniref:Ubiquitin-conjugating enzyme E2 n=2 Tax=Medicago truncatula TaxID=3880 RepID=G7JSB8_MEDTR|nr:ubiquitin-conjugating enzyme E2 [Medicago truncatula]
MGRVVSVDMFVDLENIQGNVLKNVNSKKLLKIHSTSEGDCVIKGPWLGQVQRVVDRLSVLFDDRTKYEITTLENDKIVPQNPNFLEDSRYPYYPGQRVKVMSSTASKSARWLCDNWRDNHDEGTVCYVEAGLVYVNWLASVPLGSNSNVNTPPCWQDSKNLTLLSCFSHANWQLGDWCMLPVADQKEQVEQMIRDSSDSYLPNKHSMARECRRRNLNSSMDELFIIGKIKTKVDNIWQNGEHTLGSDPQNLVPVNVLLMNKSSNQRWGVILSVDAKEHTVNVQRRTAPTSKPDDLAGEPTAETVSAYEFVEHPYFSCCFGDIVFKAAQKQSGYLAEKYNANSMSDLNVEAPLKNLYQISYPNNSVGNCRLSCIGNVTGFKDGHVEVKWATGLMTKVVPYEIFRIGKHEASTATPVSYETNIEELTEEITEHGSLPSDQKGKHQGESSSFSLPQTALELFSIIKASIFQKLGTTSFYGVVSTVPTFEEGNAPDFLDKKDLETCGPETDSHPASRLQSTEDSTPYCEVIRIRERSDAPVSSDSNGSDQLKRFDVIDTCSDHHFFNERKGYWAKKVQQEWSILEKNLPETIYVRVFEERMDLMRAAIVGASGTPYHDGLFFFDICFPPEYPNEPPMVHYISGGLRINPNLYESGKVCLSLLNTWSGTATEVWNPGASTVLQVLLSLQALVLNKKPYFNEAGCDQQIGRAEGEKNSVSYNENAFLLTCKSMLGLLRKPPELEMEMLNPLGLV